MDELFLDPDEVVDDELGEPAEAMLDWKKIAGKCKKRKEKSSCSDTKINFEMEWKISAL